MYEFNNDISHYKFMLERLTRYATNAQPDTIIKGIRRYHFHTDMNNVFFLEKGCFLVRLKENDRIISYVSSPCILGVFETTDTPIYLERINHAVVKKMSIDEYLRLIKEHELDSYAIKIYQDHYNILAEAIALCNKDTQEEVKKVSTFWRKAPQEILRSFSALYLVENSTCLSRSTVFRNLKILASQGFVKLMKGRFLYEPT